MESQDTAADPVAEIVSSVPEDVKNQVETLLRSALTDHQGLPEARRRVDEMVGRRNANVVRLRAMGLSGYRIARVFGVSDTSVANWIKED